MWGKEEYGTGRCINCGYLGKKDTEGVGAICFTVSAEDRTSGSLNYDLTFHRGHTRLHTIPWCIVGKADLKYELDQLDSSQNEESSILSIITKDRNCPSWYPWREFASPKEMWDESITFAIDKNREEFELNLFEMNKKLIQRNHWVMVFLGLAAIFFAVVQLIVN